MTEISSVNNNNKNNEITVINLEENILRENDLIAQEVRNVLNQKGIYAVNLISSPGSGKTTLLEETLKLLKNNVPCGVIEGDQQTSRDAERIFATGVPVVQVNTMQSCHLNAAQVMESLKRLPTDQIKMLFIENVGNLVCPAAMDLGETEKIILMSITEGEDKPIKYPLAFQLAHLLIMTKMDLLPYVRFNHKDFLKFVRQINPSITILETSAYTHEGLDNLVEYLINGMLFATNNHE